MGSRNIWFPYSPHLVLLSCFLSGHFFLAIAQRSTYIVHLDKSSMPTVFADHHLWHSSTIESIKAVVPSSVDRFHSVPKLVYSYDNVFHGFSAVLSKDELKALKKSPGFISAYKDRTVEPHTTHTSDFLKLTPSSGLWKASNLGQDVIIGVLDGGIWPESASFRDDGIPEIPKRWKGICKPGTQFNTSMCNRKLIGANYFNKGILASDPTVNISMNSARDTNGHGTHCASIAAGNFAKGVSHFGYAPGTARGVAYRMGAGHVDPNRALDPGLVYDATPQDYINLICSMNFTEEQFKTFARSSANYYNCSNPSADLNYPSFIALYSIKGNFTWLEKKFRRTLTNVGKGGATYK